MTTIHSMTASQSGMDTIDIPIYPIPNYYIIPLLYHTIIVVDCPSGRDWRAGRCAGMNIIPATTGAGYPTI